MSSILSFLKEHKDAFSSIGSIVALIIFGFAVYQYRRGETWKKSEFIAKLYKDFADDPDCQRAMWMMDWGNRPINFGSTDKPVIEECDHRLLISALRQHDSKGFSETEMRIRDTFDRFFMYVEQFERAIQNRLVDEERVYPYFTYWIELLNGKRHMSDDVRLAVLKYIGDYGFSDVRRFLNRWGG